MWNTTTGSGYTNDIFGIGWDEGSDLRQPQSKSASTDEIITLEAV